jgi:uncharacterized metal-binding protein YceD (DUF177 family)
MTDDPGFHRPQSLAALPEPGLEIAIEAKPAERKALAAFLDIPEVRVLRADLLVQRWRGQGVRVTGTILAEVTQSCVVTLDPVPARVKIDTDRKFLPEAMLDRDADPHELLIDPDGEDPPDPLPNVLDLGVLAAEELALNLDPYPRKADSAADQAFPEERPESPFAALKNVVKT